MGRERPVRLGSVCPTPVKVELVLRLLAGESVADLSRETGRSRKQLSAWRRRFLAGGEQRLAGDPGNAEQLEAAQQARDELALALADSESQRRLLSWRLTLLSRKHSGGVRTHPNCSEAYARTLAEAGVQPMCVPEWHTHVLVREGVGGTRQAAGVRPIAALDPDCDLPGGLDTLRDAGIASVNLITDPMWCPELPALESTFDTCRPFKRFFFVDREAKAPRVRKRHRNSVNRARRECTVREVSLADQLDRWQELYQGKVVDRQIATPFSPTYFERLTEVHGLRTVAVLVDGEIATMTLWFCHEDMTYFHDAVSSGAGFANAASYAAFAHVIENTPGCRFIFLGGSADFRDAPGDGVALFKRGFANASTISYLCSAALRTTSVGASVRPRRATATAATN